MYKLWTSIKKEYRLLINDITGLSLMFIMPLLLVVIITIIQDSAFNAVNDNRVSLLLVNKVEGKISQELKKMLIDGQMFDLVENENLSLKELEKKVINSESLTGLYIEHDFSEKLNQNSAQMSQMFLSNLGLFDNKESEMIEPPIVHFFNDPALQENYSTSILKVIYSYLNIIEISQMIEGLYAEMGEDSIPAEIKKGLFENNIEIIRGTNDSESNLILPNSTQHNVPAWTIFAMFFMVVSLGTNIAQEKKTGAFIRLRTIPTHFGLVMLSKEIVFMIVGVLQVFVIFAVGVLLFPLIGLNELAIPENLLGLLAVVLVSAFAAVSYAVMLGSLADTPEQSNGFGAISIIIFAAIGGIWVPTFVMPEYMKIISQISPLHWCLEAFYTLFLRNGEWIMLSKSLYILIVFSFICQLISFLNLKKKKLI